MKAWLAKGTLLAAALLTLAMPLRASDPDTEPISFTASTTGSWCPGDTVNFSFQLCNSNIFSIQPGRFYVALEDVAIVGATSCNFLASGSAGQWLLTNDLGAVNPPTQVTNWGTAPFGGGYSANITAAGTCRSFNFSTVLPSNLVWGRSYRVVLKSTSNYYGQTGVNCDYLTVPFTACIPSSSNSSLQKSVEGTANSADGQFMVYWLDYDIINSVNNQVRDTIPAPGGCPLTIVETSPNPSNGSAASIVGQTVTWALGDAGAVQNYRNQGRLFVKVQLPATCTGTFSNTAEYNLNNTGWQSSNTVTQTGGQSNLVLIKSQLDAGYMPVSTMTSGARVNYVLEYTFSGFGLTCFDSFDALALGTYTGASNAGAFGAWKYSAAATPYSWTVANDGNNGRLVSYIHNPGEYDVLSYDCDASETNGEDTCPNNGGGTGQMMVEADIRLDHTNGNGDVGVVLRDNGLVPTDSNYRSYSVLLSTDPNPTNYLMIQKIAGTSVIQPAAASSALLIPVVGSWYTVKALEQRNAASQSTIYVKVWLRGNPEPAAWMITWANTDATFDCPPAPNGGNNWHSGLGGQADQMSWDNFRVYAGSSLSGASVLDTIPAGIDYGGASPAPNGSTPAGSGANEGAIRWDFTGSNYGAVGGLLYEGTGSFTWWGLADCTEASTAVNTAQAGATLPAVTRNSNTTSLSIACASPTATITASPTISTTPTRTPSITVTRTVTPSATVTRTATPAVTLTASPTPGTCTPTSLRLCVNPDDEADVYVNGLSLGTFSYVNWDAVGTVPCTVITNPAVLSALGAGGTLAVRVHNIGSGETWVAYTLDITCSSGMHAYLNSDASGQAYHQMDCAAPPAAPPGAGSPNWYDAAFAPSGWSAIFAYTGTVWGKPVYDPPSGAVLVPRSYSAAGTAATSCDYVYLRQGFTLVPVVAPSAPAFTITKSADITSGVTTGNRVTYTMHVCNIGGFTDRPVTVTDTLHPNWRFDGPYPADTVSGPNYFVSGNLITLTWPNGYPGNGCQDVGIYVVDDYQDMSTENCQVRANTAQVSYYASAGAGSTTNVTSNNVNVTMLCATLTATPVPSATATLTITPPAITSATPTRTITVTATLTATRSNTTTVTPTTTVSSTATASLMATDTTSPTTTNTPRPTLTATSTNTPRPTLTATATITPTPTLTVSTTPTATASTTATRTPTVSYSSTPTATPTATSGASFTASPTPVPSWTSTPAPLVTIVIPGCCGRIYPSPARPPFVNLGFNLPRPATVRLVVLDSRLRPVLNADYTVPAGPTSVPVDIRKLRRGIYFYRVLITLDDGTVLRPSSGRFTVVK